MRLAGLVHLCLQNKFAKKEQFLGEANLSVDMLGPGKTEIYLAFDYDYNVEQTTTQVVPADFEDVVYLPMLLMTFNVEGARHFDIYKLTLERVKNGDKRHLFYAMRSSMRSAISEVFSGQLDENDISVLVDSLLLYDFGFSDNDTAYAYAESRELYLEKPLTPASLKKVKYIMYREVFMITDDNDCPPIAEEADLEDLINALNENGGSDRSGAYRFVIINK